MKQTLRMRRSFVTLIVAMLLVSTPIVVTNTSLVARADTQPINDACYAIKNAQTGYYLDSIGVQPLSASTSTKTARALYFLRDSGNGYWRIDSYYLAGRALSTDAYETTVTPTIIDVDPIYQRFFLEPTTYNGLECYQITSVGSNAYKAISAVSSSVTLADKNSTGYQKWILEYNSNPAFVVGLQRRIASVESDGPSNNGFIAYGTTTIGFGGPFYNYPTESKFIIKHHSGNKFYIESARYPGYVFTAPSADGGTMSLAPYAGDTNQLFTISISISDHQLFGTVWFNSVAYSGRKICSRSGIPGATCSSSTSTNYKFMMAST